jgi:hypothetical protein
MIGCNLGRWCEIASGHFRVKHALGNFCQRQKVERDFLQFTVFHRSVPRYKTLMFFFGIYLCHRSGMISLADRDGHAKHLARLATATRCRLEH